MNIFDKSHPIDGNRKAEFFDLGTIKKFLPILVLLAIAGTAGLIVFFNVMTPASAEFIIQPKIDGVAINANSNFVLREGESFIIDFNDSSVPSPPVIYMYDNNGDGVVETPFTNGTWAKFTMVKTYPLYKVCEPVENGEFCIAKIVGTDSAGNKAEFLFHSTTIYN
jgi:hypothetical protein